MIQLEEKCREYKALLKATSKQDQTESMSISQKETSVYASNVTSIAANTLETIPEGATSRYDELQRANLILMRAKESQYKKGQYIKNKYEKKLLILQ